MNKWIDWINKNPFAAMGIMLALASIWVQYKGTKKLASVFETHKTRRRNPGKQYHAGRVESISKLPKTNYYLGRKDEAIQSMMLSKLVGIPNPRARRRKQTKARK